MRQTWRENLRHPTGIGPLDLLIAVMAVVAALCVAMAVYVGWFENFRPPAPLGLCPVNLSDAVHMHPGRSCLTVNLSHPVTAGPVHFNYVTDICTATHARTCTDVGPITRPRGTP